MNKYPEPVLLKCPHCDFLGSPADVELHLDCCLGNEDNFKCETCQHLEAFCLDSESSRDCEMWVPANISKGAHETAVISYAPFEYRRSE